MSIIRHITNFERAASIIGQRAIHGACLPGLECYPHFLHGAYSKDTNALNVSRDVELIFECDLPERHCTTELPEPGFLYVHFRDHEFRQCTLHPSSPPITLVDFDTPKGCPEALSIALKDAVARKLKVRIVWPPDSEIARQMGQRPLREVKSGSTAERLRKLLSSWWTGR